MLLTGDCSGKASLIDSQSGSVKKWNVCKNEVEKVMWNVYNPFTFFVATSEGFIYGIDSRNESSNLFTLKAHSQMISGLELRYVAEDFLKHLTYLVPFSAHLAQAVW